MSAKVGLPKLTRVRDVMAPRLVEISVSATRAVAAATLVQHHIGGAPVRGTSGELIGMISAADLLDPQRAGESVGELMTHLLYGVRADDPVMVAVDLLAQKQVHRLLVLDDRAGVCGIVTAMDIVQALADGLTLTGEYERGAIEFRKLVQPPEL